MDCKNIILNELLNKYEVSKSLVSNSNRKIILKVDKLKEYNIEDYEAKKLFHDVVFDLEKKQIVFYSWKPYEKRQLIR